MRLVPAGSFLMGCAEGGEFERPVHPVHLDGFYIDETPTTNRDFAGFVDATGFRTDAERAGRAWGWHAGRFGWVTGLSWRRYASPGREEHPVVLVSWNDAAAYARWAGKRLPTEAEWEKAARGGLEGMLYPWGNDAPDAGRCHFGRGPQETPPTAPARSYPPNGYGLYDMAGNVWQWCGDWYGEDTYVSGPANDPTGPAAGRLRVRRGASWNVVQPFRLRCANRGAAEPSQAVPNMGFRCAISLIR